MAGRVALVTGAAAGIGAACARLFCAEGARGVVLVDRDPKALQATRLELERAWPAVALHAVTAEVADTAALTAAIEQAVARCGALHTLVNNAAMRHHGPLAEADDANWQAVLGVNLVGTAAACRAALPALRDSGRGSIVNVSSCYAVTGRRGMGLYDATKAALLSLTRTLAAEESAHGVRVNAVCPGSTLTEFHLHRAQAAGTPVEVAGRRRPAGRSGRVREARQRPAAGVTGATRARGRRSGGEPAARVGLTMAVSTSFLKAPP